MGKLYRIKPLEKKNVENVIEMYQVLPNGDTRGFTVSEWFRWGQGFRTLDEPIMQSDVDAGELRFETFVGWGSELEDLCSVYVEFHGEFTEAEQEEITNLVEYETEDADGLQGTQWLFDGDHDWRVEDDYVLIHGPVEIDIVDEHSYNEVLESGIDPEPDAAVATDWPFSSGN